jgi:hypothetical protein
LDENENVRPITIALHLDSISSAPGYELRSVSVNNEVVYEEQDEKKKRQLHEYPETPLIGRWIQAICFLVVEINRAHCNNSN